jgi:hypothetical protein
VQTENTGAERVEATRLGVANLLRSLGGWTPARRATPSSTPRPTTWCWAAMWAAEVGQAAGRRRMPPLGAAKGRGHVLVPAAEQREAVRYLLGEGAASLEPYADPAVLERVSVYGGYRAIDRLRPVLSATDERAQRRAARKPEAARPGGLLAAGPGPRRDRRGVGRPEAAPPAHARAAAWLRRRARKLLQAWAKGGADEAAEARQLAGRHAAVSAGRARAGGKRRRHGVHPLAAMAVQATRLMKVGMP